MGAGALTRQDILGVVLAGGQSRRFGRDKAVAQLDGRRLIERVAARALPQTAALAISGVDYGLGLPVIPDAMTSEGPLTGVLSALRWGRARGFSAVASFSCDAPFFPPNLVARLAENAPTSGCSFVSAGGMRHPAFALWHTSIFDRLQRIYNVGTRALGAALDEIAAVGVSFPDGSGPGGDMFFNINNRDDLALAQAWLARDRFHGLIAPSGLETLSSSARHD